MLVPPAVPPAPESSSTPAPLRGALAALASRARSVDLWVFEPLTAASLRAELVPVVVDLLVDAERLVDRALASAVADAAPPTLRTLPPPPPLPPKRAPRAPEPPRDDVPSSRGRGFATAFALEPAPLEGTSLDDVAFLAMLEIGQRRARLERAATSDAPSDVLVACDGALRKVVRLAATLDAALARAAGQPPGIVVPDELDDALRTRRAIACARRLVLGDGEPEGDDDVVRRVHLAAAALANLTGWHAYPLLGVGERLRLAELDVRIADWSERGAHAAGARKLFRDVASLVRRLAAFGHRRDLVAHDRGIVVRAVARVMGDAELLPTDVVDELRGLAGVGDAVDDLLEDEDERERAATWRPLLARLARRFGVHAPPGLLGHDGTDAGPDAIVELDDADVELVFVADEPTLRSRAPGLAGSKATSQR